MLTRLLVWLAAAAWAGTSLLACDAENAAGSAEVSSGAGASDVADSELVGVSSVETDTALFDDNGPWDEADIGASAGLADGGAAEEPECRLQDACQADPTEEPGDPCQAPTVTVSWATWLHARGPLAPGPGGGVPLFDSVDLGDVDTALTAVAASVGDVTGDGRPDIVLASLVPRLLVNCGDVGFAEMPLPVMPGAPPMSTLIVDADDDGDMDLVYGGASGGVQLVLQTEPFVFVARPIIELAPGQAGVTVNSLALHGDLLHAGQVSFPPRPALDFGEDVDAINFDKHKAPNRTLRFVDGDLELLPAEVHDPAADACWHAPTFASLAIPRHHIGLPDLLFEGNDFGPDCLSEIADGDSPLFPLLPVEGTFNDVNATMGADYYYDGDRVVLATSEFVARPHLWSIGEGADVEATDDLLTWVDNMGYRITWGTAFADFDGDSYRDLLVAHSAFVFEDPDIPDAAKEFLKSVAHGGLMLLRGDAFGGFTEAPELLPEFDDGAFYAVVVGDFYGDDGRGDGCPDVLVTPMVSVPPEDAPDGTMPNPLTTPRLLICRPAPMFTGVRLPHGRWASRAVVGLETTDGDMVWEPVRSSAGIAGSRDAVARFAVHAAQIPARFHVHLGDGEVHVIEAPKVNVYATLPAP